jgi:hypothetical protein
MSKKLHERFSIACRDLYRDVKGGFDSGTNLIGVMELPSGRMVQIHITFVTDEMDFLDADAVTGCADDLVISAKDMQPEKS